MPLPPGLQQRLDGWEVLMCGGLLLRFSTSSNVSESPKGSPSPYFTRDKAEAKVGGYGLGTWVFYESKLILSEEGLESKSCLGLSKEMVAMSLDDCQGNVYSRGLS